MLAARTFVIGLLTSLAALTFAAHSTPPTPAAPPAQVWTTGAQGLLPDPHFSGQVTINLATEGTYDNERWCVILDYQSLTVELNATVRFSPHPSGAPVVIRSVGPIQLRGTLDLSGSRGHSHLELPSYAQPGPGGFRGGIGEGTVPNDLNSAGFGPGGGLLHPTLSNYDGGFASHFTNPVENNIGLPNAPAGALYNSIAAPLLIGGSGGSAGHPGAGVANGGGAGGGAILIGSDESVQFFQGGRILARGGDGTQVSVGADHARGGPGSGGMIRIAAPILQLGSNLGNISDARGGTELSGGGVGGSGHIKIETPSGTTTMPFGTTTSPTHSSGFLTDFLPLPTHTVAVHSWWDPQTQRWTPITTNPSARITSSAEADAQLSGPGQYTVRIRASGIPIRAPLEVRMTYTRGNAVLDTSHKVGEVPGSTPQESWTDVTIDFSLGVSAVQVRALL